MASKTRYRALTYHDPSIVTILILASFVLSSNAINYALDRLIYCGLVGQILIGIALGAPGLQWLSLEVQEVVTQLGYIGLILIIYEGGLSTNLRILRANLLLSSLVAITGIALPIALSYILQPMLNISALQAFAAGAALCSTSLGTTFTVLQTSGLSRSRLGVILAGAAMMDDVVGLVLVQVISALGQQPTINAQVIIRPIGVSLAYAVATPLACKHIVRPMGTRLRPDHLSHKVRTIMTRPFCVHTCVLVAFIASAGFAGTSTLFAAYLAGVCITWWDDETASGANSTQSSTAGEQDNAADSTDERVPTTIPERAADRTMLTGTQVYHQYYASVVRYLLQPFFFASIGFSIPIAQMFQGEIVWKGIVYSMLMMLGKMACGLWLVRFSFKLPDLSTDSLKSLIRALLIKGARLSPQNSDATADNKSHTEKGSTPSHGAEMGQSATTNNAPPPPCKEIKKPQSLYPAGILGMAMVSRGEIGFLISAVASSSGLYTMSETDSQLFLVVTWAIMLCTIIGPAATGLLVKRVWQLQKAERHTHSGRQDPLGVWGAE